ncbi:MAG: hypothetical protein M1401_17925 [Chloroflexi bacterium]|nr:hypothetical protein [Chloroflexota bacterium]
MRSPGRFALPLLFAVSLLLTACRPPATVPAATARPLPSPTASPIATTAPSPTPTGTVGPTPTTITPASQTPTLPAVTATPAAAEGRSVTLADDGRTIDMRVGERFLLALGEGYDWTVDIADPSVLSRVVNVLTVRGSQGLYEAHRAGTTALTATGDPPCRRAQPACAAPSRLFQVTVVVQP